jgi:glyoxylate/hydroxypyruvate reductase
MMADFGKRGAKRGMRHGKDTLLFYSELDNPATWGRALMAELPGATFHAFPDMPDPASVTAAIVWQPPLGFFAPLTNLRLIVNLGAGMDAFADRTDLPDVPIVRLSDPEMVGLMTSYVLFSVIRYARNIDVFEAAQQQADWRYIEPRPLSAIKVGVLGLGELGAAAAGALTRLGLDVAGWSRSPKQLPGVACVHGRDALDALISEVEILLIMLPLTAATKGLIDEARLRRMKPGAKLINVARGPIIDEDALIAVLREGHLGGATLDVFAREPLPSDSPLWQMPNVLITPHVASIPVPESAAKVVAESIRRMGRGEPPLHQVDRVRGY